MRVSGTIPDLPMCPDGGGIIGTSVSSDFVFVMEGSTKRHSIIIFVSPTSKTESQNEQ